MNILPQITQITQRGMQQAALYRRERQIGEVNVVLLFGVRLRKSARSAGDFLGFICANRLSTLM